MPGQAAPEDHPISIRQVETGPGAEKLKQFKAQASKGRIHAEFKSPADLRGHVIQGLAELKEREEAESEEERATSFHPPNVIPQAPETYIAHPYSLLQTSEVVGRQAELNLLTHWVANPRHDAYQARLFNLVAIGGMGKSAVTWKWFNEVAPNEMPDLAGRMWWSFYESDARYENFIIRALAYGAGKSEEEVRKMAPPEREDQLWQLLDQKPFLLVLDGLERILIAYARMDAAQMLDDDLDEKTANRVFAAAHGIPDDVRETYLEKHRLRMTADPRAGKFLRRLSQMRASRILVTTRLFPADLQTITAAPVPGCDASFLRGLTDDDAINLWRAFGVSGSREQLLPLFRSFENYPLLLRALAGEVAEYRSAPGNRPISMPRPRLTKTMSKASKT
ncbi:MAG: hypothetical protein QGF00_10715 [Planctomycetota bacterium]|nr:hypothetical protein [Planctomycetota bacterium]MDP7250061.1 hypothetical protein [Planctomycetota bacterium]